MIFTIDTRDLQDALSVVTRSLSSKPAKPVYGGIHAKAQDNTLTLTCTDGQFTARWSGPADISDEGEAILPGKMLSELARKLPGGSVSFKSDTTSVTITYNKARSRLSLITGEYPEPRDITSPYHITLPAVQLRDMISHVQPCIATDQTRLILTGALLEIDPNSVAMVSLDGFRLGRKEIPMTTGISTRSVIPGKFLSDLARSLPQTDAPATITIGDGSIRVEFSGCTFSTILLAGEYIDYKRLLPDKFDTVAKVDRNELQDALSRASLLAREGKNNTVKLEITGSILSVSAQSDSGATTEQIDVLQNGPDLTIAFNAAYIFDAVRNAPADSIILNANTPTAPLVITSDSDSSWMYLVLPVRVF